MTIVRRPGGKTRLLPRLRPHVPPFPGRLVSPFVGGGALEFDLLQRRPELRGRAILSDADAELVATYIAVRDDPEGVIATLAKQAWDRDAFYQLRDMAADQVAALSVAERAARYVAVNKMSFNGLSRQNTQGESNQAYAPFDARRVPLLGRKILDVSRLLQGVELVSSDFELMVDAAGPGDFVFADGPYHGAAMFVGYVAAGFTESDHVRQAAALRRATERGAKVLTTNSDTEFIRSLYPPPWTVHETVRRSGMAGDASSRHAVTELIIASYQPDVAAKVVSIPKHHPANMTGNHDGAGAGTGASMQAEPKMTQQGRRLPDAAVAERTEFVGELLRAGSRRPAVQKATREKYPGISTRTIDSYIARVRERWAIEACSAPSLTEAREASRQGFLDELRTDVVEAKAAGTWSAVAALRRLQGEVMGLRQPRPEVREPAQSVSHTTSNTLIVMNDTERAHKLAQLERLLERRKAAATAIDTEGEADDVTASE